MMGKKFDTKDYIENTTIEGLYTLHAITNIVKNNNINMPIITMIDDIVNGKKSPDDFIKLLIKLK